MLKPGDEIMVLPSGFTSRIASIETADSPVDEAFPPMSVTVRLTDEIDIARGDLICRPHNAPKPVQDIDALICWMDESAALEPGRKYSVKHTTRNARAVVKELQYRLDVNTLHRDESAGSLKLNEIGRCACARPCPCSRTPTGSNRTTGGFIVIDEGTNRTVGAAMILE